MSNFAECTLIKLVPSEPHFVALTTYDIHHGRSTRFLLHKKDLASLVNDPDANLILDTDIGSYVEISRRAMHLHFRLVLLHQDYRDNVTGYVKYFELPVDKIQALLNGQSIHHVEHSREEKPKAELIFTDNCHKMIRKVCQDKLTKHALRRFFRDHFNYGRDEQLIIHPDSWVNGFFFQCDRLSGGIVMHDDVVKGRDGRQYKKVFFSMHT